MSKNTTCLALMTGIVLFIASVPAVAEATVKVFLLAGQSNMGGAGSVALLESPYDAPQPDVNFWNNTTNSWGALQPGWGNTSAEFGPELTFGYEINLAFPDDDIYLVKYAPSSTSLYSDWNPNGSGWCYNNFKSEANAALANLAGSSPMVAGMIWMQGESDAINGTASASAYEENLTNFIGQVRSDFATPDMPFVVGRINAYAWGTPENNNLVRTAQMTVPGVVGQASWFDTDDLPLSLFGHYNTQGQLTLGDRFADHIVQISEPEPGTSFDQVDPGSTLEGYVSNTWDVNTYGKEWLSAELLVELTGGDIYQDTAGSDTPPDPADFTATPTLEFDTYMTGGYDTDVATGTLPLVLGAAVDLNGGTPTAVTFDTSLIDATWASSLATNPSGELMLARFTLSDDAQGTFKFRIGLDNSEATFYLEGVIADGAMLLTAPIPGDADGDGDVDAGDAAILADNWQKTGGATWQMGDFNDDQNVDDADATILAANWGVGVAAAAVPEPSTMVMLATVGPCLLAGICWRHQPEQLTKWETEFNCFRRRRISL